MQVLQDVCGDIAGIGATDSNFEDNVWAFYASEDSTCFAVRISNHFSALDVEEVPPDTQLLTLVPPAQLQHSNRRKNRGQTASVINQDMFPEVGKEAVNSILPVDSVSHPFLLCIHQET